MIAGLASASLLASAAFAGSVDVDSNMSVYGADQTNTWVQNNIGGATAPASLSVAGDTSLTFSVSGGPITLNSGGNWNDADGVGSAGTSYTDGINGLSSVGLPNAGALVAVFVDTNTYSTGDTAPTALDYRSGGNASTTDSSYSPVLDQVFFLGDGLTGDGTGSTQTFYVPTGATSLYIGIADAGGYYGYPGSYGDNYNAGGFSQQDSDGADPFVVSFVGAGQVNGVPDAGSAALLMALGAVALVVAARKRVTACA